MLKFIRFNKIVTTAVLLSSLGVFISVAHANHSWGTYHWGRTATPFVLKLGDNVSSAWDSYLATASSDWSLYSVLDTTVVPGTTNPKNCRATNGRVEVCNNKYGNNGWLGLASIWVSGNHITQGTVKVNDTYFNTARYNTPAWKRLVMCQEVGHPLGLNHQDEAFSNLNLGTCMDYTNDPSGTINGQLSNEHPNTHDYEQLEAIYAHLDGGTTLSSSSQPPGAAMVAAAQTNDYSNFMELDLTELKEWGEVVRHDGNNRGSLYKRDLGHGNKIFTFVVWAD